MRDFRLLLRFAGLILMSLLMPLSADAQERESFAIMDLEGRGISAVEAQALTDRLNSLVVRTGKVTVVERGAMQAILQEQDFQLSGCTSDECAVEVGQLLGVTKMVAGSIGKLGSTYSIDLRIIDVSTGKIAKSIIRDYRGEIDGLLAEMAVVALELVAGESQPEPVAARPEVQPPVQAQPEPPPVAQQQQPRQQPARERVEESPAEEPAPARGGRGILWLLLGAAAIGGALAIAPGGTGPPGDEATVGLPPAVPSP